MLKRFGIMHVLLAAAACALLLAAGCNGSGGDSNGNFQPDAPVLPGQDAIGQVNDGRLDQVGDPTSYGVKGTLGIDGFTVLGGDGQPVGIDQAIPELQARLLDPEEDILWAQARPGVDGLYTMRYTVHAPSQVVGNGPEEPGPIPGRFEVSVTVAEDLNGDGEGGDVLHQVVPLRLKPGVDVRVDLLLSRGDDRRVDPNLLPEQGEWVLADLIAVDGNGAKDDLYGVFFFDGATVYDLDGDEFLEFGEDFYGPDLDNNGQIDDYELPSAPADGMFPLFVEGTITAVNPSKLTLHLRTFESLEYTIQLDPQTPIELWDIHGLPIGSLPLTPQLVGMLAYAEGPAEGMVLNAWQVVVFEE